MSSITKDQLIFDTSDLADSDNIGAYLRASDGTLITKTTNGAKEGLDVNIINDDLDIRDLSAAQDSIQSNTHDGAGNAINSTGGSLDVNVTSISDATHYAEDSAHSSGDNGQFMLAVRNDADSSLVDTDGDYAPLQVDNEGRLKVAMEVTVEAGDAEFLKGSIAGDTDAGIHTLAIRQDTLAGFTGIADGDYTSLKVDALGRLYTNSAIQGDVADDDADSGNPLKVGSRTVDGVLGQIASGDRADMISDRYRRVYVNSSAAIAVQSSVASVTATAGPLMGTPLSGRRKVVIQNQGSKEVYLGGATVSSANGLEVKRRASIELELGEDVALYAVCETGETAQLRLLEIA